MSGCLVPMQRSFSWAFACIFNSCFVFEKEEKRLFFHVFVWTFMTVYVYSEQLLLLLCWLAHIAHMQSSSFSGFSVGGSPAAQKKPWVWKLYVKEQFFNTRRQVRCVNASYGSEWFRMYLDGSHAMDPTQFPAPFITLFYRVSTLAMQTLCWLKLRNCIKYKRGFLCPCMDACVTLYVNLYLCVWHSHKGVSQVYVRMCVQALKEFVSSQLVLLIRASV